MAEDKLDYTNESNVVPEAEGKRRKSGGRAKRAAGGAVAGFARGGGMKHVDGEGHKGRMRLDRPGRKRGGGIGATTRPLSSAATVTQAEAHKADNDEMPD